MTSSIQRAGRLTLIGLAAAALAACASGPRPMGPAATQTVPPPPSNEPRNSPAPPPGQVTERQETGAPVPGTARDFVINAGDVVYFDFDSYSLRDDAHPILEAQAAWLRRYPAVHVRIEGNCDDRGTREYNFALGARRANAVREFLLGHGLAAARIATVSYGKEHPVDPGTGDEAQARNRNARTAVTEGAR